MRWRLINSVPGITPGAFLFHHHPAKKQKSPPNLPGGLST
jgi:hypothetical protein